MERRSFLKMSAVIGGAALMPGMITHSLGKEVIKSNQVEIITLSDGHIRLPLSLVYPSASETDIQEVAGDALMEGGMIKSNLNLTLLRYDDRVVLFDVGSGSNFMPTAGKLSESFAAINLSPDDITDVVFTHAHPDHLWGVLDEFDDVLFPEATLHISKKEFEYWMDDATLAGLPDERKTMALGAKTRLEIMEEKLNIFEMGIEVLPKIEALDTSGHTPGHTSYVIHAGREPVMVVGDAINNSVISFKKPDWPFGFDQDPEKGVKARKMLLDRLATDKMQMVGYHMANEGVGRVEAADGAYRFVPS